MFTHEERRFFENGRDIIILPNLHGDGHSDFMVGCWGSLNLVFLSALQTEIRNERTLARYEINMINQLNQSTSFNIFLHV